MTAIGLPHYLIVAAILFTIGVFGIFVNRKNVIIILMSIELILLAVNINLVAFSAFLHEITGQIFAMIVLTTIPVLLAQRLMRDTGVLRRSAGNVTEAVESAQITAV